jgi:hypothetical protein
VSEERFTLDKFPFTDLRIAVGESATGQAYAYVGVGSECSADAEFRVEINRSHRQAQRQIAAKKSRRVAVIECIAANRGMPLESLIIAQLDQLPRDRVNLCI